MMVVMSGCGAGLAGAEDGRRLGRPETLAYGAEPRQALDFWRARERAGGAPLIVFVHGGGWQNGDKRGTQHSQQAPHYLSTGYAFAALNYRLVPAVNVETQAQDVALALKYLIERAASLGFDRKRVVLMGHSAGAHLAALLVHPVLQFLRFAAAGGQARQQQQRGAQPCRAGEIEGHAGGLHLRGALVLASASRALRTSASSTASR
jgi:carboxylesterase type B